MNDKFPFSLQGVQSRVAGTFYPSSWTVMGDAALWLQREGNKKWLGIISRPEDARFAAFQGETAAFQGGYVLRKCPTSTENGNALRETVPYLKPRPMGLATSAGMGDRLGLATPGHVRSLQKVKAEHPAVSIMPVFCQQSIREMTRTRRSPVDVMRDATWGTFEAGWTGGVGADADHLKTTVDIDNCAAAGFTFYTIDPGAFVDSAADTASAAALEEKMAALPWNKLETSAAETTRLYVDQKVDLGYQKLKLERVSIYKAAVKYGKAIAHVVEMYRHLAAKNIACELEVSVDETDTPTTHIEHIYIASELKRLGVRWVSLAPRYVGRFEKGVDYIGDLQALDVDLAGHAAIARVMGPYKLSLHSGSDKFSVYPLAAKATGGLVHLKTAGTSYLEAMRTLARKDAVLFRRMMALAVERYATDKATYHVSAELAKVPQVPALKDSELPGLLDQFDARQVIHVTFGSILDQFEKELRAALWTYEEAYYEALESHFIRHLSLFVR